MRTAPKSLCVLFGVLVASLGICQNAPSVQRERSVGPVVFVCEHGNVKSLIAASLFEQVAKQRGLPFRAVSRGISPEAKVPSSIVDSLRKDGIETASYKPQPLTSHDLSTASHVIAIGVDLSSFTGAKQIPSELWSDVPPASIDYEASRAALLHHIDVLLEKMQSER
jgi:arsenate reductase